MTKEIKEEFWKFILEVTDERKWLKGKPTYNGYVYVTLANAIWDWIEKALANNTKRVKKEMLELASAHFVNCKGFKKFLDRAIKEIK